MSSNSFKSFKQSFGKPPSEDSPSSDEAMTNWLVESISKYYNPTKIHTAKDFINITQILHREATKMTGGIITGNNKMPKAENTLLPLCTFFVLASMVQKSFLQMLEKDVEVLKLPAKTLCTMMITSMKHNLTKKKSNLEIDTIKATAKEEWERKFGDRATSSATSSFKNRFKK